MYTITEEVMESVRVDEKGQINLTRDMMEKHGIKNGMEFKIVKNGKYCFLIPTDFNPLKEMQDICEGLAEELGLKTEEDVVRYSKEIRKQRAIENANHG